MTLSALPGLSEWCAENDYNLEDHGPDEATMTDEENGNVWSLFRTEADGFLQVGCFVGQVGTSHAVSLTLARLHDRQLGCRYGIGEDGWLRLRADIYPHDQTGIAVGAVVTQMQWVSDFTRELIKRAEESNSPAEDADIDAAFGLLPETLVN